MPDHGLHMKNNKLMTSNQYQHCFPCDCVQAICVLLILVIIIRARTRCFYGDYGGKLPPVMVINPLFYFG